MPSLQWPTTNTRTWYTIAETWVLFVFPGSSITGFCFIKSTDWPKCIESTYGFTFLLIVCRKKVIFWTWIFFNYCILTYSAITLLNIVSISNKDAGEFFFLFKRFKKPFELNCNMGRLQIAGISNSAGHLPLPQTLAMDSVKSNWPVYLLPGIPYTYKQDYSVIEYELSYDVSSLTRNTV